MTFVMPEYAFIFGAWAVLLVLLVLVLAYRALAEEPGPRSSWLLEETAEGALILKLTAPDGRCAELSFTPKQWDVFAEFLFGLPRDARDTLYHSITLKAHKAHAASNPIDGPHG